MEGTGFLGAHSSEVYRLADDDLYLVGTSEVALAGYHSGEILDAASLPLRYAGLLVVLPPRGRLVRQGHQGHHPRALVRQGRDVLLRLGRRRRATSTAACSPGSASSWTSSNSRTGSSTSRPATWARRAAAQVRHRGVVPVAGRLPRADVDLELHDVPVPAAEHPLTRRRRRRPAPGNEPVATLNGTLCAIARTIACLLDHHQQPDGSVYVPGGAAAVARRPRGAHRSVSPR